MMFTLVAFVISILGLVCFPIWLMFKFFGWVIKPILDAPMGSIILFSSFIVIIGVGCLELISQAPNPQAWLPISILGITTLLVIGSMMFGNNFMEPEELTDEKMKRLRAEIKDAISKWDAICNMELPDDITESKTYKAMKKAREFVDYPSSVDDLARYHGFVHDSLAMVIESIQHLNEKRIREDNIRKSKEAQEAYLKACERMQAEAKRQEEQRQAHLQAQLERQRAEEARDREMRASFEHLLNSQ